MGTSTQKRKLIYILLIMILSFILGLLYASKLDINLKKDIISLANSQTINNINYFHIGAPIIALLCSFIFIGIVMIIILIMFESFSIGVCTYYYFKYFKIKGLIYNVITIIFSKSLYLFLLIILLFLIVKIINRVINKNKDSEKLFTYIRMSLYTIILITINEFLIKYIFSKIYLYFSFLIK